MTAEMQEMLKKLTKKEQLYFRIMWAKYGVLYITSKPGVAKSAIALNIAESMNHAYMDMRLSMNDESDFKYPFLTDVQYNGEDIKVSGFAVPDWAYQANQQPTIIHFEELNRAPLFVRNAALQILLERKIGDFKFNDNVIMMASGNLGAEDGTDVDELDSALNNRLIHIKHDLSVNEWLEEFAYENCHRMITQFIKTFPDRMYVNPKENSPAYATPRTWTMLSKYIVDNYGMDSSVEDFIEDIKVIASGYIGNTALKFIKYCEDMLVVSIQDVLNDYERMKPDLLKFNRDKNSELLQSLREIDLLELSSKQMDNVIKFLNGTVDKRTGEITGGVGADEKVGYILFVIDESKDFKNALKNDGMKKFFRAFEKEIAPIAKYNEGNYVRNELN